MKVIKLATPIKLVRRTASKVSGEVGSTYRKAKKYREEKPEREMQKWEEEEPYLQAKARHKGFEKRAGVTHRSTSAKLSSLSGVLLKSTRGSTKAKPKKRHSPSVSTSFESRSVYGGLSNLRRLQTGSSGSGIDLSRLRSLTVPRVSSGKRTTRKQR